MSIPSNIAKGYGRKTTVDYIRMLYISFGSVCELGTVKKDLAKNRMNVKSADKIFRKQTLESLTPGILGPSSPTKLEKNH